MIFIILFIAEIIALYFLSKKLKRLLFQRLYRATRSTDRTVRAFALLFFPGTLVHELSHFLTALFLLVPVGEIQLVPKVDENKGVIMGSVSIGKTDPVRRLIVGGAPFLVGSTLLLVLVWFAATTDSAHRFAISVLTAYMAFQVGNTMFSSKKDMEGAWVVGIMLIFAVVIIHLLGIRVSITEASIIFSDTVTDVLRQIALYMLVPIVIDSVAIFVLRERHT